MVGGACFRSRPPSGFDRWGDRSVRVRLTGLFPMGLAQGE